MWYTPYHQDQDDIVRRKKERLESSNTSWLVWVIIWLVLILIFV